MNKKDLKVIKEKMIEITSMIMESKSKIITEEATKQSLILPFFKGLGYDVFNPLEFCPEFNADFGVKKGEKVDYAISLDEKLTILIEAKGINVKLDKHAGQLSRYFNTCNVPIGILTNGIEYRFFSDIEAQNRMDEEPFYIINMLEIKDKDIHFLYRFLRNEFSENKVRELANELKEKKKIRDILRVELINPSDDFVSMIMGSVNNKRKTATYIEKSKPLVKEILEETLTEIAIDKIEKEIEDPSVSVKPTSKIVTTEEELVAYGLILSMYSEYIALNNICYKDTENYLNILLLNNTRRWICRLYLNGSKKYIVFADGEKVYIEDIGDICKMKEKFVQALAMRVKEIQESENTK
ncbi:MAG: type I restriction enzyme HsdR N-terminal domain-containing protein [Clostridium sp.]